MAWKKVIVSGSQAELANIVVDNNVTASAFSGDGSGLTFNGTSIVSGSAQTVANLVNQDVNLGTGDITGSNLHLTGNATIDGNVTLGGNITIGDATTDNITFAGDVSSSIIPDATDTYDLGSSTKEWNRLYVNNITASGQISASAFVGDGSQLTNITVDQSATVASSFTSQTSVAVNHNFNSKNVNVAVYNDSDVQIIPASVTLTNNNTVTVTFDSATSGRVVVAKGGHIVSGSIAASSVTGLNALVDTYGYATTASNTFYGDQTISGSIVPLYSASFDLGSVDKPWRDVYISTASLYFVDENGQVVTTVNAGNVVTTDNLVTELPAGVVSSSAQIGDGIVSGSSFSSPSQGTVRATVNGVQTDVDTGLQTGDSPTFSSLTLTGDLVVQGTTTSIETANLLVEDKFILLNSGSANPDQGGIIIDEGNGAGHAFIYNNTAGRFGFTGSLASTSATATPNAFAAAVVDIDAGHSDIAEYQKNGNIKTDSGTVYIFA